MSSITPTSPGSVGPDDTITQVSTSRGTTVINTGVVAKIAGLAVREVSGVYAVGGGAARALGAIREAISSTDHSQGITVEVTDNQVAVELSLVAEYPAPLQEVADAVRTAVIDAIEDLVGMQVTEVNVTIKDVHIPDTADVEPDTDTSAEPGAL